MCAEECSLDVNLESFPPFRGIGFSNAQGFGKIPPLFMKMSMLPKHSSTDFTAALTASSDVMSTCKGRIIGGEKLDLWASALSSSVTSSRPDQAAIAILLQPAFTSRTAVVRPIPLDAPVMTMVFPVSSEPVGVMYG